VPFFLKNPTGVAKVHPRECRQIRIVAAMAAKTSTFQISALRSGTMGSQECEGDSFAQVGHQDTVLLKGE
jgi:hypothetical protein